jgi:hypothetical protein
MGDELAAIRAMKRRGERDLGAELLVAREGPRHAFSGEIARGLFGRGAAGAGPAVEGRQPEPAASVAGCSQGRNGSRRGGEGWRHGPPDAARLGPSLQRPRVWRASSTTGPKARLASAEQLAEFAQIVEAGPDRGQDGVVRWRRIDLRRVIAERLGVDFHSRYVGKLLQKLGTSLNTMRA